MLAAAVVGSASVSTGVIVWHLQRVVRALQTVTRDLQSLGVPMTPLEEIEVSALRAMKPFSDVILEEQF